MPPGQKIDSCLSKEEVASVIEGRSTASRVPLLIHFWTHTFTFEEKADAANAILARYPEDVQIASFRMPDIFNAPEDDPEYRWLPYGNPATDQNVGADAGVGMDAHVAMADWSRLDETIEKFPEASSRHLCANMPEADGRYRLGQWFFGFFERHWSLRGMDNALTDYYAYPDEVHRLFRAMCDFYKGIIERGAKEQGIDGLWTSDDIGTQTGAFFSPEIFREFFKPYWTEMFDLCHELGLHTWMHACGDVTPFIDDWIDSGLDVLHPIQKHAMDERDVAARFGDRLTFLSGLDVQQVIPFGTPDEVRAEVRHLLDTFWRPGEGRLVLSAGNGINYDCPLESLEAFFDEAMTYGAVVAAKAG